MSRLAHGNLCALGKTAKAKKPDPLSQETVYVYQCIPSGSASAKVVVTDMNGTVIRDVSISAKGAGQFIIDGNTLAAGAYNYTLWINGKQTETRQMVVGRQ